MRFRVLALDYDGTIAVGGRMDPDVAAAVAELRRGGERTVVLVTGRILEDLRRCAGRLDGFDAVVAEEGGVIAFPRSGTSRRTAAPPPRALLDGLRALGIPHAIGQCLVECEARFGERVLALLRELELPQVIHFNRGRMMVLPQSVSKATGLREALRVLRLSSHNAVAIGDAENDHELLSACELGVAVSWGSAALRKAADRVLEGAGPGAVAGFVRELARSAEVPRAGGRRHLLLGRGADCAEVHLEILGRNALVAGDPSSGKSWLTGLLAEQLVLQGYGLCVIDPEGDYGELASLPGVEMLGGEDELPGARELGRLFARPDASAVIDLSRTPRARQASYVAWLLALLGDLRERSGLPHRVIIDEAHYFLHDPALTERLSSAMHGTTLVTYKVSELAAGIREASEAILVTRETDPREARLLHALSGTSESVEHWLETLAALEIDEAALLPSAPESGGRLQRFRLAPRLTRHVRHEHKYLDAPLDEERAFRFESADGSIPRSAHSLRELTEVLECAAPGTLDGHLQRGDFSRWVADVFRDRPLSARVAELEELHRLDRLPDVRGALIGAVRERYRTAGEAERSPAVG